MNDKLKQIAVKAQVEHCISHVRLEEFAELIIADILSIINNPINYNECVYTTFDADRADGVAKQLAKKIKEHFKDAQ